MKILTLAVLALGLAVHGASAIAADQRPLLQDVSAIRVANYGTTLVLLSGTRTVALFRVGQELVVERAQAKGQSSYSLAVGQADLPRTSALLTGIPPAKDCN